MEQGCCEGMQCCTKSEVAQRGDEPPLIVTPESDLGRVLQAAARSRTVLRQRRSPLLE